MVDANLDVKATASGFNETKAAVDDLNASVQKTTASQNQAAAAIGAEVKSVEDLVPGLTNLKARADALAQSTTAAAEGVGFFSRAMTALSGPLGILITVLVALLTHVKEIGEWFGRLGERLDAWVNGVGQGTPVVDAHGKVIEALDPKYRNLAAAQDLHTRALAASRAGLIEATEDAKRLDAEEVLREATLHRITVATQEYTAALQEFGIKAFQSFSTVKAEQQAFFTEYQRVLTSDGPAAARIFVEENAGALDRIISRYVKLGKEVPEELKKVADSIGLVSKAESELAKNEDLEKKYEKTVGTLKEKLGDLSKTLTDNAKAFQEHTAKIEADRQAAVAAIETSTAKTIAGLQEQVKATNDAFAARTISATEYNQKINQIFADEAAAKRKAVEEEAAIDAKAAKDRADLSTKYAEETKKITDAQQELIDKQAEAQKRLEALNVVMTAQLQALVGVKPALFEAGVHTNELANANELLAGNTKAAAEAQRAMVAEFAAGVGQASALGSVIQALTGQVNSLAAAAAAAAVAIASMTDGPGGAAQ